MRRKETNLTHSLIHFKGMACPKRFRHLLNKNSGLMFQIHVHVVSRVEGITETCVLFHFKKYNIIS